MQFKIKIHTSDRLALRDPEDTALGRRIVRQGLLLIHQLGLEAFTFKKLAAELGTTEASLYRYFENKHRLLLYLLTWYWNYLEYLVVFNLNNLDSSEEKIHRIINLLVRELPDGFDDSGIDKKALHQIVVAESSKAYLTREVNEINQSQLFKPFKDLCGRIAEVFKEYNPEYPFPRSLSSTLLEMAHFQYHFMLNLPSLTDFGQDKREENVVAYLENLVFSALRKS